MTPLGGAPTVRRNLIHDVAGDVPFFTDMALSAIRRAPMTG